MSLLFRKNRRILNPIFKSLLLVVFGVVIYRQIIGQENAHELWQLFVSNLSWANAGFLVLLLALMPFNWAMETIKWRYLLKDYESLSFQKAYKAILAGISLSVITPARIGEYGGRLFMVKAKNNWKAVLATLVGSLSQNLIHFIFGIAGFVYFFKVIYPIDVWILNLTFALSVILIALLFICFYHLDIIENIVRKIPFPKRIKPVLSNLKQLKNYREKELSRVLFYSFIRYLIFSIQYYLILKFFGIDLPLLVAFAGIATIYLVQTSIPLPPILGVFARGEVAIFIWGALTKNTLGILAATFGLWIINLIIPALIGMVIIMNVNVLNSLGYDEKK